jgi:glutamate-ammonia-ligase adenylyltransferase
MVREGLKIEELISDLPDSAGARHFYHHFSTEYHSEARKLARNAGLLSDVLSLASWSPLLSTTLVQHPDYVQWLGRERVNPRVRTREELSESLARFNLTNSQLDPQVLLARFRRRELLRIYLRDIRNTSTIVETTEELSNLADTVLAHALSLAQQEMDNRYGQPQCTDDRGRIARASFCIVALGKLGSFELNYASDIDLLFLYSDEGTTSGQGSRGEISNREYFVKLAETITRIVGQQIGEGAAYRVDLRLRPHGRDGTLASSLDEATRYYRQKAQPWELQALIRARPAAGANALFARFAERVSQNVFRTDVTVYEALENVRIAKQKIDRQNAIEGGGFNVKLGTGGIREIEFIAQALQLANGGRDEWLRAPHTLVSLGRLADRGLITQAERVNLFEAYLFLRKLEHRLQMEHGLQTHTLPQDPAGLAVVARRMDFRGKGAAVDFEGELGRHTRHVSAAFQHVFGNGNIAASARSAHRGSTKAEPHKRPQIEIEQHVDSETGSALYVSSVFAPMTESLDGPSLARALLDWSARSSNPRRALTVLRRIASSLEKSSIRVVFDEAGIRRLIELGAASEHFGEMIAANPSLLGVVLSSDARPAGRNYQELLEEALSAEETFGRRLALLRQQWSRLLLGIGIEDASESITMREANRLQTELASAAIDVGIRTACDELKKRFGGFAREPRLAVLGLGRLGGRGMDYGSDVDVVLIYDDKSPSPVKGIEHVEFYARFTELLVSALSSLTREGYLYRVDLRLRPDGRNGPLASSASGFLEYLKARSAPWEWLAYVKLRSAAGDREFGENVEKDARELIHAAAHRADPVTLRAETLRVREKLQTEKTKRYPRSIDIKYGTGGMLDVYFASRYLQLRDDVPDMYEDRSTSMTLRRLVEAGSLGKREYERLRDGYALLRRLDHLIRLTIERSTRLPAEDHPAMGDIAARMGYSSARDLLDHVNQAMQGIRAAYDMIMKE